jgi:serine/threonine-protein kinase
MTNAGVLPFDLRLFGGADLRGVAQETADGLLAQPKITGILSYMAVKSADGAWQRRDTVAALFWPELDQAHARAALRKSLLALRGALGPNAVPNRGDEDVRLSEQVVVCDVVRFTRAIDSGRYARALEEYRGELLPGFHLSGCGDFERWLDDQRAEARERASAAAWALARLSEENASMTEAGSWARKAVRYSWQDERVLRRTLTLLDRVGDRAGALALFDEFARRLKADFDADPSPETMALVRQLRGG